MAGENLAVNFVEVEDEHQAWMNSTGHRANIMNENFKEIGIGIKIGEFQGGTSTIVVQMFGTPAVQNVALSEKPTPVEQPKTVAAEKNCPASNPSSERTEEVVLAARSRSCSNCAGTARRSFHS
jgi:hypothetical protein